MSEYTSSVSRPGQKGLSGTDPLELFMRHFSEEVLEAYEETFDFNNQTYVRSIAAGKSDVFPIVGRKRDASDHTPGEIILGGKIDHNEVEVTLDPMLVDSVFIAEIDELMAHYSLSAPYSRQIGESLASASNSRIGRMLVIASRETNAPYEGGPLPSYFHHANMATDPAQLEEAAFKAVEHVRENDIGGGPMTYWLPWQQQLLLAKYTGIDTQDTSGSGNRAAGTVGQIAGLSIRGTNSIPKTNVTTGIEKYRGDFTPTIGLIANTMAVATLRRRGVRVTLTKQDDRLGHLLIGSKLEGHGKYRPECAFEVRTTAR